MINAESRRQLQQIYRSEGFHDRQADFRGRAEKRSHHSFVTSEDIAEGPVERHNREELLAERDPYENWNCPRQQPLQAPTAIEQDQRQISHHNRYEQRAA